MCHEAREGWDLGGTLSDMAVSGVEGDVKRSKRDNSVAQVNVAVTRRGVLTPKATGENASRSFILAYTYDATLYIRLRKASC